MIEFDIFCPVGGLVEFPEENPENSCYFYFRPYFKPMAA